ncbi:zinc finger protein [Sesbania bispinosa]|nr:zinc finger protein [Sesbania bispinosa]
MLRSSSTPRGSHLTSITSHRKQHPTSATPSPRFSNFIFSPKSNHLRSLHRSLPRTQSGLHRVSLQQTQPLSPPCNLLHSCSQRIAEPPPPISSQRHRPTICP